MRVVRARQSSEERQQRHRLRIQGDFLEELVVGALEERGRGSHDGRAAGARNACRVSHGV